MTTIPISPEALESIRRMTVQLTEDNKMLLDALKGLVAWADDLRRQDPLEDLRKAREAIAKIEAQPAVMEKP